MEHIPGLDISNMDEILLTRLRLIHDKMKNDIGNIPSTLIGENLILGQVAHSKLESSVRRFGCDLNEYFRMVTIASADDISQMSVTQLEAEEVLAELGVKINQILSEIKVKENTNNFKANISSELPKLHLPEFDGNILNWHQFWDQFSSNIDSKSLSDVDKLSYLKASLRDDAKKAIDGLETTNRNYKIALDTLKERYGKNSYLIDAHYSTLYKINTAVNTAADCRQILNEIERHLRILESLGEDINHNHLRFLIMEKFPSELIYEIKLKANTESIQELRSQLEKTITAREDAERISQKKSSNDIESCTVEALHTHARQMRLGHRHVNQGDRFNRRENTFPLKRNFEEIQFKTNENFYSPKKIKRIACIFCNGAHYNETCDKFKTIYDRKLKLKNRCFGCFQEGHIIRNCRDVKECPYCKLKGHNRALCPQNFDNDQ